MMEVSRPPEYASTTLLILVLPSFALIACPLSPPPDADSRGTIGVDCRPARRTPSQRAHSKSLSPADALCHRELNLHHLAVIFSLLGSKMAPNKNPRGGDQTVQRWKESSLIAIVAVIAMTGLMGQGYDPSASPTDEPPQSPGASQASPVEPVIPSEPAATTPVAPAAKTPAAETKATQPAPKKEKKAAKTEVLPWANAPAVAAAPPADPNDPAVAAQQAAAAQCSSLFEASCRDLKTCAWIADVALPDGTTSPARCVARPPAPPKKAAKKAPATPATTPKKTSETQGVAPAVKSSVTTADGPAAEK